MPGPETHEADRISRIPASTARGGREGGRRLDTYLVSGQDSGASCFCCRYSALRCRRPGSDPPRPRSRCSPRKTGPADPWSVSASRAAKTVTGAFFTASEPNQEPSASPDLARRCGDLEAVEPLDHPLPYGQGPRGRHPDPLTVVPVLVLAVVRVLDLVAYLTCYCRRDQTI